AGGGNREHPRAQGRAANARFEPPCASVASELKGAAHLLAYARLVGGALGPRSVEGRLHREAERPVVADDELVSADRGRPPTTGGGRLVNRADGLAASSAARAMGGARPHRGHMRRRTDGLLRLRLNQEGVVGPSEATGEAQDRVDVRLGAVVAPDD